MDLNFKDLLYDHSLVRVREQPQKTDGSQRRGYPDEEAIVKELRKWGAVSIDNIGYKWNGLHFKFRYNSQGNASFGGLSVHPSLLLIAIIRKREEEDTYTYSAVRVNLAIRDYDPSASWSMSTHNTDTEHWSKFPSLEETNAYIVKMIREAAKGVNDA